MTLYHREFSIASLAVIGWLHDFVTLGGGGRTVYGVECVGGSWKGSFHEADT